MYKKLAEENIPGLQTTLGVNTSMVLDGEDVVCSYLSCFDFDEEDYPSASFKIPVSEYKRGLEELKIKGACKVIGEYGHIEITKKDDSVVISAYARGGQVIAWSIKAKLSEIEI